MARQTKQGSGYVAPVQMSFQFEPVDPAELRTPVGSALLGSGKPPQGWMAHAEVMALARLIDADLSHAQRG